MRLLLTLASALYALALFLCLAVFRLPLRVFSLCALLFALACLLLIGTREKGKRSFRSLLFPLFLLAASLIFLFTDSSLVFRLYPLIVNAAFFVTFLGSLLAGKGESIVWTFASRADRKMPYRSTQGAVRRYCRKVTGLWCLFFVANFSLALWTVVSGDMGLWTLYNGCIAYILMGVLFGGEFVVRCHVSKKSAKPVLFSDLRRDSHPDDQIICYSGHWTEGKYLTWRDFVGDVAKMRDFVRSRPERRWILHSDDFWYFAVCFVALAEEKRLACLTANITPLYLSDLWEEGTAMLCDVPCPRAFLIGDILAARKESDDLSIAPIEEEGTKVCLYTSGSTGHPKAVVHTLTELQADYLYVIDVFGKKAEGRVMASSVNPHHIFGFLHSGLGPMMIGCPFRREKVDNPDELISLGDAPLWFVVTPAFLKRCIEDPMIQGHGGPVLQDPFIPSSGGPLSKDVASRSEKFLGAWPVEIYGSTETLGIAWRITKDADRWTPYRGVKLRAAEDGTLIISTPYLNHGADYETSDLVSFSPDGSFTLQGRKDSVVKIEEKRISLPEVEKRIMALGWFSDCAAVALSDKGRQYIGAIVILNEKGREMLGPMNTFRRLTTLRTALAQSLEAIFLPRKWRYVDKIPQTAEGKRPKERLLALFLSEEWKGIVFSLPSAEDGVFSIHVMPKADSPFYDGHFDEFKLLPALAQVDIVDHVIREHLDSGWRTKEIPKTKFSRPVAPGTVLVLSLSKNPQGGWNFVFAGKTGGDVYARGRVRND